ncbi:MAG: hypothetical protein IH964_06405 [Candidatus Dadabacteria bacterium]|nr:hypothetical protein [Candidatus Dadabacteria bacterium]MCH7950237.1 hypothetical protein [Candidatus Dadabacteria bacterium]
MFPKTYYELMAVLMLCALLGDTTYSQTEGFNVKTPTEKMADTASKFLEEIIDESKNNPRKSISKDLICNAKCYLVIPSIYEVPTREDFEGNGILSCRKSDSNMLSIPIFYKLTELKSFYESGGGVILLVMNEAGVKSILAEQVELNPENTTIGTTGSNSESIKSFVSFAMISGNPTQGYDLNGSTLIYGNRDTFNAYQQSINPIDIILESLDVPPALRGFDAAVTNWRQSCK